MYISKEHYEQFIKRIEKIEEQNDNISHRSNLLRDTVVKNEAELKTIMYEITNFVDYIRNWLF